MSISTMDIEYSPDMGGKEGLSALGYSRVYKSEDTEFWAMDTKSHRYQISFNRFVSLNRLDSAYLCKATCVVRDDGGWATAMQLSACEMEACARRMRELEAEVDG